jgi:hypothetical protein
MLKENKKTLKQIDKYIKNHTPTVFSRGSGKSGMILNMIQINYGLEIYKDVVREATEYMSFEQVLMLVGDAIYHGYKEMEENAE